MDIFMGNFYLGICNGRIFKKNLTEKIQKFNEGNSKFNEENSN